MLKTSVLYFILVSYLKLQVLALQCLDEEGKPVDWYVIYKIPKIKSHGTPNIRRGSGYMFLTSKTVNGSWEISKKKIFDNSTLVANTLAPFYKNNQSELWIVYNDQPPNKKASRTFGHTKGVVGADKNSGFWLVHSVPKYPPQVRYNYPGTGAKFGQNFICVSLPSSQLNSLGANILRYNQPYIYNVTLSKDLETDFPDLASAARGDRVKQPPWFKKTTLSTSGSTQFQAFAKAKLYGKDLYEWVANDLNSSLLTETWRNQEGALPSECNTTLKVMNVDSISYNGINFNSTHDHSKWAIGTEIGNPWVCIGDINRALPQEKRGGGTLCLENTQLWRSYRNITNSVEACPRAPNPTTNTGSSKHNNYYKFTLISVDLF